MARTKQFDERQALVAAMLTFWEKGYEGTSIQDLEQAMGLKRTSIYNAFGNKRAVFNRIVGCYKESVLSAFIAAMDAAPDIRSGVKALLDASLDMHFAHDTPGGCLVVLSVVESEQHDQESQAYLQQIMGELSNSLKSRLRKAKKAGELAKHININHIATTITTTMAGMMVLAMANVDRATLEKTVDQILTLLD